jgi:hypothetical protein
MFENRMMRKIFGPKSTAHSHSRMQKSGESCYLLFYNDEMKGCEVGEESSMHGRDYKFVRTEGKYHLDGLCINRSAILKWVLMTQHGREPCIYVS